MAILFSKSRYQREEWIGNHTCRLLQQNTNLFSQWNVNTNDYKFNSFSWKITFCCQNSRDGWMRWLFGTFLLQNQLGTLQDCRFLFPGRLFKGKGIVHSFNLHLFLGKDEQLKSILMNVYYIVDVCGLIIVPRAFKVFSSLIVFYLS